MRPSHHECRTGTHDSGTVQHTYTAHITLMAEQRSTLVVRCCHAGAASKSDAVLHKELLRLWVYNIYIHHAVHHRMVVSSCPCLLSSIWMTCGSTLCCYFLTRSFSASRQWCEAYMLTITQHYLGNVVSHCYGNLITHSWKNRTFPCTWHQKKKIFIFLPTWYHC